MDIKHKLTLGVATLAVALGAGHLVQSGRADRAGLAETADVSAAPTAITPLVASAKTQDVPPPLPALARLSPEPAAPAIIPSAQKPMAIPVSLTPDVPPPAALTPAPASTDSCRITLDIVPGANAMLDLTLLAPCKPDTRVVLRHGGLAVTGRTSGGGALFTALPAMDAKGEVAAMFPDGTIARSKAPVDLSGIQRFAVQWMADDRFALNAYRGGAAFGAPGHIRGGAKGKPDGDAGWLLALGDASVDLPMMAEVYTWPAKAADIAIDIEAPVTEATCNRELLGETLQSQSGSITRSDITLAMPDCSAVGDFLVLNNVLAGTTTAAAD